MNIPSASVTSTDNTFAGIYSLKKRLDLQPINCYHYEMWRNEMIQWSMILLLSSQNDKMSIVPLIDQQKGQI